MTNKIEIIFDIKTAEQDDKKRTLTGKLIAYNAKRDYLYVDLRNLVKLPNDIYSKEAAMKYWGTERIPRDIKAISNGDSDLLIEYNNPDFPIKALEYIYNENKDIINSIKLTSGNEVIYEASKNNKIKLKR